MVKKYNFWINFALLPHIFCHTVFIRRKLPRKSISKGTKVEVRLNIMQRSHLSFILKFLKETSHILKSWYIDVKKIFDGFSKWILQLYLTNYLVSNTKWTTFNQSVCSRISLHLWSPKISFFKNLFEQISLHQMKI